MSVSIIKQLCNWFSCAMSVWMEQTWQLATRMGLVDAIVCNVHWCMCGVKYVALNTYIKINKKSVYVFLHLTTMYNCTYGRGLVTAYFTVCALLAWMSLGRFSLWEFTCLHSVYIALWTGKVLCGFYLMFFLFFLCATYKFSFIHAKKSHQNSIIYFMWISNIWDIE